MRRNQKSWVRRSSALALTLVVAAGTAGSRAHADAPPIPLPFRPGDLSCDEWFRDPAIHPRLREWIRVDLARQVAVTSYRVNIAEHVSSDENDQWVDGYCHAHPLDGLAVTVVRLMNDLSIRAVPRR
jgi:hypothetical protein